MNIHHFDLPFLLAFLYLLLFGPGLSLPFSLVTHLPLAHLLILSRTFLFTPFFQLFLFIFSLVLSCFLSHQQLKASRLHPSWSCHACTRSGLRSRVPNGPTRIRVVSCTLSAAAPAKSLLLCPLPSQRTQLETTPALFRSTMGRRCGQQNLWLFPLKV